MSENSDEMYGKYVKEFGENGYTVIPGFLDNATVEELLNESDRLVAEHNESGDRCIFETKTNCLRTDYFINSGDKIRYFYEEGALNESGDLLVPKEIALNKIGHALHWLNPLFKKVTFGQNVKTILKELGYLKPAVVQSMVIFKHRKIGGVVTPHQDASYLFTIPEITALGFWIAMEDATLENGCLWFIPGSHKYPLERRFIKNPNGSDPPLIFTTDEKKIYDEKLFVPVPVKKGDCVLIHGLSVHKSEENKSDKSRPAYTFHIIDEGRSEWAYNNWLQPTETLPFPHLY